MHDELPETGRFVIVDGLRDPRRRDCSGRPTRCRDGRPGNRLPAQHPLDPERCDRGGTLGALQTARLPGDHNRPAGHRPQTTGPLAWNPICSIPAALSITWGWAVWSTEWMPISMVILIFRIATSMSAALLRSPTSFLDAGMILIVTAVELTQADSGAVPDRRRSDQDSNDLGG